MNALQYTLFDIILCNYFCTVDYFPIQMSCTDAVWSTKTLTTIIQIHEKYKNIAYIYITKL